MPVILPLAVGLILACADVAPDGAVPLERVTDAPVTDSRVVPWMTRFRTRVAAISPTTREVGAVTLADYAVRLGQCRLALALCAKLEPPDERRDALVVLAGLFAEEGRVDEANLVASLLQARQGEGAEGGPYGEAYRCALFRMASGFARRGDRKLADTVTSRLGELDAAYADELRLRLARIQAYRGDIQTALAYVAAMRSDALAENRRWTLEEIETCRRRRPNQPSTENGGPEAAFLQELRTVAAVFSAEDERGSDDALLKSEERARATKHPISRAARWRAIGWEHHRRGDAEACRRAVGECRAALKQIHPELSLPRAIEGALAADLAMTVGERAAAVELAQFAAAALASNDEQAEFAGGLSQPLAVAALVRAGEAPSALALVQRHSKCSTSTWFALGAMCAFGHNPDVLNKAYGEAPNEVAGAAIALGAAYAYSQGAK